MRRLVGIVLLLSGLALAQGSGGSGHGSSGSGLPAGGCTDSLSPGAQTITWTAGHTYCPNAVGTYTFASAQAISADNVTVYCSNLGMALQDTSASTVLFTLSGKNDRITGCAFDGNAQTGSQAIVITGNGAKVDNNRFNNFGTASAAGIVAVNGGLNAVVDHNHFGDTVATVDNAIVLKPSSSVSTFPQVTFNDITTSATAGAHDPISVQSSTFQLNSPYVHGNQITTDTRCIRLFTGATNQVRTPTITDNHCFLNHLSGDQAYSTFGANGLVFTGNTINDEGFGFSGTNPYGIHDCWNCTVTANEAYITGGGGSPCFDMLDSQKMAFSANVCSGSLSTNGTVNNGFAAAGIGFHFASSSANVNSGGNSITGNVCVGPPSWTGVGISLDCSSANNPSVCSDDVVAGNYILGSGTAGSKGIEVKTTASNTLANTLISGNRIAGMETGISNGANVTDTNIGPNSITGATTQISDSGTRTLPQYVHLTAQTNNIAATTAYAVQANGGGRYRACATAAITTAAGTSSTLPNVNVIYTDADDSVVKTAPITASSAANTTGTASASCAYINAKASTNIQYSTTNYASNAANAMNYNLNFTLYRETQ